VLKKSVLGDERNFKGPLMHFAGGDVGGSFHKKWTTDLRIGAAELCSGSDG
jgi:hypothetical protein